MSDTPAIEFPEFMTPEWLNAVAKRIDDDVDPGPGHLIITVAVTTKTGEEVGHINYAIPAAVMSRYIGEFAGMARQALAMGGKATAEMMDGSIVDLAPKLDRGYEGEDGG